MSRGWHGHSESPLAEGCDEHERDGDGSAGPKSRGHVQLLLSAFFSENSANAWNRTANASGVHPSS